MSYNISKKSIAVDRHPMTWVERLYIPSIFKGLRITLGHIFQKKATINFPEVKREFSKWGWIPPNIPILPLAI